MKGTKAKEKEYNKKTSILVDNGASCRCDGRGGLLKRCIYQHKALIGLSRHRTFIPISIEFLLCTRVQTRRQDFSKPLQSLLLLAVNIKVIEV